MPSDKAIAAGVGAVGAVFLLVSLWPKRAEASEGEGGGGEGPALNPARQALVDAARSMLGTPYQWGGGRSPKYDWGVDCSGLIIASARIAGLPLPPCSLATSNGWWQCLERISDPLPGDLSLYGYSGKAVHVEMVTSFDPATGIAQTIGSNGGDSSTTSPAIAQQQNAYVKESTSESKRFLGFCRYPLEKLLGQLDTGQSLVQPDIFKLQDDEMLGSDQP